MYFNAGSLEGVVNRSREPTIFLRAGSLDDVVIVAGSCDVP